jgi:hypothetical protein
VKEEDSQYHPSHRRLWTVMVYIAGDNNLSANSIAIMQDLEEASRSSDVRVVAAYDSSAPFHKGARYLEIQHKLYEGNYPINWGLHNDMVYPPGHPSWLPIFATNSRQRSSHGAYCTRSTLAFSLLGVAAPSRTPVHVHSVRSQRTRSR